MANEDKKEDKKFSWKGSPNAGLVLLIVALIGGVFVIALGFLG